MKFKDLDQSLWKAVMQDLEKLILHYEFGNKVISLGFDEKLRQYIARLIKEDDKVLEIGIGHRMRGSSPASFATINLSLIHI